ncbi:MAG: HAD-IIIA family hydrolase [Candidatus Vogelbacteria bacterium]|nr:HAD-IIIA family hydrolase [Candidatus Vogelbacteria bacterium]
MSSEHNIRQAVILAGGRGSRLRPITDTIPKPMVLVCEKPFLLHLVEYLKEQGVGEIVLLLGYLGELVKDFFGDGSRFGIRIVYSVMPPEFDTGARIVAARDILDDRFLLMYCDNYCPVQLERLAEFHAEQGVSAAITLYSNKYGVTKNNTQVDDFGRVRQYDKKREAVGLNALDIGFFILNKEVIDLLPEGNVSFEREAIPRLIEKNDLAGFVTHHAYYSVGSLERLPIAEKYLSPRKVLFLDRDGVINRKPKRAEYITSWEQFEFLPEAVSSLKSLRDCGYEMYIISNQAGIARGAMSEGELDTIHHAMAMTLEKDGVAFGGVYYCPHGWDDGCECRKPRPGMFFRAAREHHINLTRAIFVGDDERDKAAGVAAGCRTILVDAEKGIQAALKELL